MILREFLDRASDDEDIIVDNLIRNFESLDESRKSQFVGKLIGLGVLIRAEDGSLQPGPNSGMSKEEVIKKISSGAKRKKIKKAIKKVFTGKK
ncbi:MAG: hypothetical protein ABH873_00235 [Candidatus Firestonebacteria bacterium]